MKREEVIKNLEEVVNIIIGNIDLLKDGFRPGNEEWSKASKLLYPCMNYLINRQDDLMDIDEFKKNIYYEIVVDEGTTFIFLSPTKTEINDSYSVYSTLAKQFKADFPEYNIYEEGTAYFGIYDPKSTKPLHPTILEEKLKSNPRYSKGSWEE